jgi:chromosomal replication initiation ATPase DnaA
MRQKAIKRASYITKKSEAMTKQYILPVSDPSAEYNPHDYIFSDCNFALKGILDALPGSAGTLPYPNIMILQGSDKSGKTHFAHLFHNKTKANWLHPISEMEDIKNKYCIIDNIDQGWSENKLFHLFNYLSENKITTLMTCKSLESFKLRDLSSRLASSRSFFVKSPDDMMIKAILSKHLSSRSITFSEDLIKFLVNRIPRSFDAIFNTIDYIDKLALEKKRNINVSFLASVIDDIF